jgi:hypothetical protein
LQKKTSKKFAEGKVPEVKETEQSKKKKVTSRVRLLPLSERQIVHGRNWIPMTEAREEESDCNSNWMLKFTELRISDIADINQGEGQIMKLWNLHMTKYHGSGLKNMDNIVLEFVNSQKGKILQHNLYRNLVAHLTNLHTAGVISAKTILSSMNVIQTEIISEGSPMSELTKSWRAQWRNVEDHSPRSVQCSTSKPSPLSRGMKIMNLSLSSQKSRDGAKKARLSPTVSSPASLLAPITPTMAETEQQPRTDSQSHSVPAKKPRLSDLSSNSSPGSLLLQLSDSSFSSHSSGIAKDESTLVYDNAGQ